MGFILLLMISTFAVAASAAFFSVYGLAQIFSASFIPVIIMGGSLEVGKLVAASYLYRFWGPTPKLLRAYLFIAVFTLMIVTSLGIFGFLTAAYQTDSIGLKQQQEQIILYEGQKVSYQERLAGINDDIDRVGDNYITKRMELIDKYEEEKKNIIQNLEETDAKLLELKSRVLTTEAKIGPIIWVAAVLDESPDKATFWFVLIIIGVFDPLAVSLTLATNIAMKKRMELKANKTVSRAIGEVVEDAKHVLEDVAEHTEHTIDDAVHNLNEEDPIVSTNEIKELKDLIMQSQNTEQIDAITKTVGRMETELKRSAFRDTLGKIKRS